MPQHSATRRRASTAVSVGVTAVLATTLAGCANDDSTPKADYAKICREESTQLRVEDEKCNGSGGHGHGYVPYFLLLGAGRTTIPAVGTKTMGGTTTIPAGKSSTSVDRKGKTFSGTSRGGFGGSGKGGFGG
ncbi:tRNA-dihydrouridine synthase [Galactobacter caseinivorans]|uniref:tRNA-dihydrouridine synthase n=1 Tax=Galactobacter caseinivorans TaxID=2676123 RepID=A0A496PGI4_9MICC|nr:tRNA-dihydrouridine synthase [Galactobacter caseinivorans]RKW69593.1 tRNA-dihydrouridine synthase [Galactobacter caseinivorans]